MADLKVRNLDDGVAMRYVRALGRREFPLKKKLGARSHAAVLDASVAVRLFVPMR